MFAKHATWQKERIRARSFRQQVKAIEIGTVKIETIQVTIDSPKVGRRMVEIGSSVYVCKLSDNYQFILSLRIPEQ